MKLGERIKQFDDDDIFFVGSRSAYMFAGTKTEFFEDLEKINASNRNTIMYAFRDNKAALRKALFYNVNPKKSFLKKCEQIIGQMECIQKYCNRIMKYADAQTNYKSIEKREVLDEYKRITDNGTVLIVGGVECSKYWFLEEYRNEKKRKGINIHTH